jgi:hypothetical protein
MKNLFTFFAAVVLTANVFAQAPQKMSYQAVIRNSSNALVSSTAVSMRISILQGSTSGTAVYVETQAATTNANGLVSIEIGAGTVVTGTFAGIDWSAGPYFIKTETDPAGGSSYSITGTSQLLSVPYALSAASASSIVNPTGLVVPKLTTTQINALPVSPAPFGTIVFNTTTNAFVGYRTTSMMTNTNYGNLALSANPLTLGVSGSIKQTFNLSSSAINAGLSIQSMSGGILSSGNLILKIYSGASGSETLQSTNTLPVNSIQNLMSFNFQNLTIPAGNGYFTLETDSTASVKVMAVSNANIDNSPQQGYLNGQALPALTGTNFQFSISWSGTVSSTGWKTF